MARVAAAPNSFAAASIVPAQESRYDEDFWFWRFGTNTFQELKAVHVGHREVEHDQIELRFFYCGSLLSKLTG